MNYFLLVTASILAAAGQLSLKKGTMAPQNFPLAIDWITSSPVLHYFFSLIFNIYIWCGFVSYGLSFLLYLAALKNTDLSIARSFSALSYVIVISLSFIIFKDRITVLKLAGISAIALGILLIALAEGKAH